MTTQQHLPSRREGQHSPKRSLAQGSAPPAPATCETLVVSGALSALLCRSKAGEKLGVRWHNEG